MRISASLVLFHNEPHHFEVAISSFLNGCDGILCVVDNSLTPLRSELFNNARVRYLHVGENLGFGRAHNYAIALLDNSSDVHLILNPDIVFEVYVLPELSKFLLLNPNVGALMPRVNYPDGSLQRLCKLLPTPLDLIIRRFIPFDWLKARLNQRYELYELPQDRPSCVPSLSGCFLLVRTKLLHQLGGFDQRYFMYLEDVDLVRRIGDVAQTMYLPSVHVTHVHAKGSYYNRKLLCYHLYSAVSYFSKWGWFIDRARHARNAAVRDSLQNSIS